MASEFNNNGYWEKKWLPQFFFLSVVVSPTNLYFNFYLIDFSLYIYLTVSMFTVQMHHCYHSLFTLITVEFNKCIDSITLIYVLTDNVDIDAFNLIACCLFLIFSTIAIIHFTSLVSQLILYFRKSFLTKINFTLQFLSIGIIK
ncbi:hypothetical protein KSF78_0005826 [Schistosoma japonicum]|nr:hypothetical protein KSF78_0005826 [Schistosoma japonicum]